MKSIHIRQVEDHTLEGLKRRAKLHRRSLQKEIEALLEDAAKMIPEVAEETSVAAELRMVTGVRTESEWSRKEIYNDDGR